MTGLSLGLMRISTFLLRFVVVELLPFKNYSCHLRIYLSLLLYKIGYISYLIFLFFQWFSELTFDYFY